MKNMNKLRGYLLLILIAFSVIFLYMLIQIIMGYTLLLYEPNIPLAVVEAATLMVIIICAGYAVFKEAKEIRGHKKNEEK